MSLQWKSSAVLDPIDFHYMDKKKHNIFFCVLWKMGVVQAWSDMRVNKWVPFLGWTLSDVPLTLRLLCLSDQVHCSSSLHCWCTGLYGVTTRNSKRSIMISKAVGDQANQSRFSPIPLILPWKDELANLLCFTVFPPLAFSCQTFSVKLEQRCPPPLQWLSSLYVQSSIHSLCSP